MDTHNTHSQMGIIGTAALIGVGLSLGRLLAAGESITWRVAAGRSIVNAGFAVAGFAVLAFIPGLSNAGQIGVAALMASLGTTGVELLMKRLTGHEVPKQPDAQ